MENERHLISQQISKLHKRQHLDHKGNNPLVVQELRTLRCIKEKILQHNATIIKADKGNTIVIIYIHDYCTKISQFISDSNISTLRHDPTPKFKKTLRSLVNKCHLLIPPDRRWSVININPSPPTIRGLIKLHKTGHPIRPIVNWKNAPAYKLAQLLIKKLNTYIPLPYVYNVKKLDPPYQ
jgi:hypothetical protein